MVDINEIPAQLILRGNVFGMKSYADMLVFMRILAAYKLIVVNEEQCLLYGIYYGDENNQYQLTSGINPEVIFLRK